MCPDDNPEKVSDQEAEGSEECVLSGYRLTLVTGRQVP